MFRGVRLRNLEMRLVTVGLEVTLGMVAVKALARIAFNTSFCFKRIKLSTQDASKMLKSGLHFYEAGTE
jgi:hypothetical protein